MSWADDDMLKTYRLVGLLAAAVLTACDPGISLYPVGWGRPNDHQWSTDVEGVHLTIGRVGGLIGSTSLAPELGVDNTTDMRFTVDGGTLESKGQKYEMQLGGNGQERWRSAEPHSKARITLWWHFDRPLYEVLGDEATATVRYRIGLRSELLIVDFKK
jgi:hypothetical protein